jgi:hypothetical protein
MCKWFFFCYLSSDSQQNGFDNSEFDRKVSIVWQKIIFIKNWIGSDPNAYWPKAILSLNWSCDLVILNCSMWTIYMPFFLTTCVSPSIVFDSVYSFSPHLRLHMRNLCVIKWWLMNDHFYPHKPNLLISRTNLIMIPCCSLKYMQMDQSW